MKHYQPEEIKQLLWTAADLKLRIKEQKEVMKPLAGKSVSMVFQKRSTRTRLSTESGMALLGGHAEFLGPDDVHIGVNESIKDTARVLSRMSDAILARVYSQRDLDVMADEATVPVISGLSDVYHPLQVLADFQTLQEHFGYLRGLKIAWVGDGNNILHSLMLGCSKLGIDLALATPKGYEPDPAIVRDAVKFAAASGSQLIVTYDPLEAVYRADAIITDTWVSMGQEDEKARRIAAFKGYQVNRKMLKDAGANWVFLHCLPRKQEEVTDDVFYDRDHSLVWDEAENRKWTVMPENTVTMATGGAIESDRLEKLTCTICLELQWCSSRVMGGIHGGYIRVLEQVNFYLEDDAKDARRKLADIQGRQPSFKRHHPAAPRRRDLKDWLDWVNTDDNQEAVRAQLYAGILMDAEGEATNLCKQHPDEKLRFVCLACDGQVICRDCKLTRHEGHRTDDLNTHFKLARHKLTDFSQRVKQQLEVAKEKSRVARRNQKMTMKKKQVIVERVKTRAAYLMELTSGWRMDQVNVKVQARVIKSVFQDVLSTRQLAFSVYQKPGSECSLVSEKALNPSSNRVIIKKSRLVSLSRKVVAFDANCRGTLFAVVHEDDTRVYLYGPGSEDPLAKYDTDHEGRSPRAVCFYEVGGQEMLAVADWGCSVVYLLNIEHEGLKFEGLLGTECPDLLTPTALAADKEGRLWIGCQGGKVFRAEPATDTSSEKSSDDDDDDDDDGGGGDGDDNDAADA
nr:hypothetical protein BaRGS_012835 [Batillaria attramentaria]